MKNRDLAHAWTDEELKRLERRISRIYREARDELSKTIKAYFESFRKRDEEMRALIGTIQNGKEWTQEDYKLWRLNQIGRGRRFEDLRDKLAQRYTEANATALAYVNDATPSIYSLNRNYAAYTIERVSGDVGFTLWDESTVRRLIVEQPDLMPYYPQEKALRRGIDLEWGKKQIRKSVTSGILQGNSVRKIATDLQARLTEMNRASAVRAARTAVTGAQNAGRIDSYHAAKRMGIKIRKEWLATLDGHTRHAHALLDGQQADVDEPFKVDGKEIRYPGDPTAHPSLVYRCRCTLVAAVDGVDTGGAQRRARDPETGKSVLIKNMTYAQWARWKTELQITKPSIAITRKDAYDVLENVGFREISKSISYIDDKTIIAQANQIRALNDKYRVISEGYTGYISAENSKRFVATTKGSFVDPKNQSLVLSFDSYAYGIEHLIQEEKKAVESKWAMPCAPENYAVYTITHEYGHILENFIIHDMVDFDKLNEKLGKAGLNVSRFSKIKKDEAKIHAKLIFKEIIDIAKKENPEFSLRDNISDYGKSDYFEAFAETFANSQLGEPNELGLAMQKWLKRRGYNE